MVDVLIIGAGPAGLMMANWMSRCGIKTRIVDKRGTKVRYTFKNLLPFVWIKCALTAKRHRFTMAKRTVSSAARWKYSTRSTSHIEHGEKRTTCLKSVFGTRTKTA